MKLSFTKMQGCANDYIYLDCRESGVPENIAALSQDLSRRHFSIGADGIICICAPVTAGADGRMRIFNADGSEAQMCGNGVRCVAEWLYTHGVAKETLVVDTNSGTKTITRKGRQLWHTLPFFVLLRELRSGGIEGVRELARARREYAALFPGKVMRADRFAPVELLVRQAGDQPAGPKISIVVPLYNTPLDFLEELLDSVVNQLIRFLV